MKGQQIALGVAGEGNREQAVAALEVLLSNLRATGTDAPEPTVAEHTARFLEFKRPRVRPKTFAGYQQYLGWFAAGFRTSRLSSLSVPLVEDECRQRFPGWGNNTRRNYYATVELFSKWAGMPLAFDKPARESAGADVVIPEAAYRLALASARGDLRPLLQFLWLTGCRPSEATAMTAEMVDWDSGTVRIKEHKTRRHGKARVVYLAPAAHEVLRTQFDRHGGGLLFRTRRGTAFTMRGLTQAVWRVGRRIGHRITAYGFRHSYATRALEMGLPDTHVAALLGHGSTRMIHANYSHVNANARLLKEAAQKVAG